VTGGILNPRSYELVGPYTDIIMQKVTLDIAFIGVNGIDPVVGPTNTGKGEASVNALLASRARVSYVLADSSKVGVRAFATMDGYEFSRLITDAGISAEDKAAFEANGTEVIVAPHEQRSSMH
jgi:DeoR family transcriptional regulator of aga operon